MRILCVCRRGNSRSVALAYLFKHRLKHEAIAVGIRQHPVDTKAMLYEWADRIILVDKKFESEIPGEYRHKLKVWDVGTDRWFGGFDKGLMAIYDRYLKIDGSEFLSKPK